MSSWRSTQLIKLYTYSLNFPRRIPLYSAVSKQPNGAMCKLLLSVHSIFVLQYLHLWMMGYNSKASSINLFNHHGKYGVMRMYHDHVPSAFHHLRTPDDPLHEMSVKIFLPRAPSMWQLHNPLCRSAGCVAYFPGGHIKILSPYSIQSSAWSYAYCVQNAFEIASSSDTDADRYVIIIKLLFYILYIYW
jgi:hypothetical protein